MNIGSRLEECPEIPFGLGPERLPVLRRPRTKILDPLLLVRAMPKRPTFGAQVLTHAAIPVVDYRTRRKRTRRRQKPARPGILVRPPPSAPDAARSRRSADRTRYARTASPATRESPTAAFGCPVSRPAPLRSPPIRSVSPSRHPHRLRRRKNYLSRTPPAQKRGGRVPPATRLEPNEPHRWPCTLRVGRRTSFADRGMEPLNAPRYHISHLLRCLRDTCRQSDDLGMGWIGREARIGFERPAKNGDLDSPRETPLDLSNLQLGEPPAPRDSQAKHLSHSIDLVIPDRGEDLQPVHGQSVLSVTKQKCGTSHSSVHDRTPFHIADHVITVRHRAFGHSNTTDSRSRLRTRRMKPSKSSRPPSGHPRSASDPRLKRTYCTTPSPRNCNPTLAPASPSHTARRLPLHTSTRPPRRTSGTASTNAQKSRSDSERNGSPSSAAHERRSSIRVRHAARWRSGERIRSSTTNDPRS